MNNDLISRSAALVALDAWCSPIEPREAMDEILELPAVDAELVRHGRWIETDYFDAHKTPIYECSACFQEVADHYIKCHKYCLHCGAKMDLGKD